MNEKFITGIQHLNVKNLLLWQGGKVIYEEHRDEDCYRNGYSATKSFTSAAFGIARDKGLVSLDEYVVDCFREELPIDVSGELEALQLKHLLSMSLGQEKPLLMGASRPRMQEKDWVRFVLGQRFVHTPGTVFQYTNAGPYLIGILVARRAGMLLSDFLYETLLEPLGFLYPTMEKDPLKRDFGAGGMMVTTEELLRFGIVFLNRGENLISSDWVSLVQKEFVPGSHYGYGFWLRDDGVYLADGKYGQFSVIMPKKHAVLAVTMDDPDPHRLLELFEKEVYPELKEV